MTRTSIREYAVAVRERYYLAWKREKGKIPLDEFTKVTRHHRKVAIRLFRRGRRSSTNKKRMWYDGTPDKIGMIPYLTAKLETR